MRARACVCLCVRTWRKQKADGPVTLNSKTRYIFLNFMLVKYVNPKVRLMKDNCVPSNFSKINLVSHD